MKTSVLRAEETPNGLTIYITAAKLVDEVVISEFGAELRELCKYAASIGKRRLIVDFQALHFASTAVIGKLVLFNKAVKQNDLTLRLRHLNPSVFELFQITKLNKVFWISNDDRDDDLEGTGCPVPNPIKPKTDVSRAEPRE